MDINGKMDITSAQYVQDLDGNNDIIEVVIDGIKMCVPISSDNRHYQAIQTWESDGNTITPASI